MTIRMYTGVRNAVSKGLAERFGFRTAATRRGAWQLCQPGSILPATGPFQQVTSAERATNLLMRYREKWESYLVMNCTFFTLTAALYADLALKGCVYEDPSIQSVITLGARFMPERALQIGVFAGDVGACLRFAMQEGVKHQTERLSCLFPMSDADLQNTFTKYGFQFEGSGFIVMEVRVGNGGERIENRE